MKNILIVGSSGHAKVVIDAIEKQGKYKIVGLIDDFRPVGVETMGYSILGGEAVMPALIESHGIDFFFVAIGDNAVRFRVARKVASICPGLRLATVIHPSSSISRNANIGDGSVLMAGAVVNAGAEVGELCILNTNSSLDHDSIMHLGSSLAPRVATGGNCRIGEHSAIGIGASIKHGVCIGSNSVIGAGAIVMDDISDNIVAYKSPAEIIRSRKHGDRYL